MTAFARHRAGPATQLTLLPGLDGAKQEADAAQFRRTRYETIQPLLRTLRLPGGHYVEPCAGDGDILEHVARGAREELTPLPSYWTAIELRESTRLHLRRIRGLDHVCAQFDVDVHDRQDFLAWTRRDESVSLVLTNWPWYGFEALVEHAFVLYPNADVIGLSCVREPLDGDYGPGGHVLVPDEFACSWCVGRGIRHDRRDRSDWWRRHPPDHLLCNGRQPFDGGRIEDGAKTKYPHPVAWMHWPRDGRDREVGTWRVLPPFQQITPEVSR